MSRLRRDSQSVALRGLAIAMVTITLFGAGHGFGAVTQDLSDATESSVTRDLARSVVFQPLAFRQKVNWLDDEYTHATRDDVFVSREIGPDALTVTVKSSAPSGFCIVLSVPKQESIGRSSSVDVTWKTDVQKGDRVAAAPITDVSGIVYTSEDLTLSGYPKYIKFHLYGVKRVSPFVVMGGVLVSE